MSAPVASDPLSHSGSTPKSKRRDKKKKGGGVKPAPAEAGKAVNGAAEGHGAEVEDTPTAADEEEHPNFDSAFTPSEEAAKASATAELSIPDEDSRPRSNGTHVAKADADVPTGKMASLSTADTEERLEVMARERETLKAEVTQLRMSLESIQGKHEEELAGVREELEASQTSREQAETQYRNLLGKVNTIKTQLGERMKADAEQLSQANAQIEEMEEQHRASQEENESLQAEISRLRTENEQNAKEASELRGRANLSQQNWVKERDELISREAYAREEFENARQAMQDWEVLAMEERSQREVLADRLAELEEQLSSQKEAFERAASERDSQSLTVDGLQRALQEIQDSRKRELRELVESSQAQVEELRKQLQKAEEASSAAQRELQTTKDELQRALPFEKEVKEKNLLIGKLRHEAVILNDHLTKALRFLKQRKPEDNVDRQLVTNHLLHFLALDRSDPKKFQVLQLIAALLSWNDEQREQAGLSRPGSNNGLKMPLSPFRRVSSTPSMDPLADSSHSKESLAELWSDFLEREAQEGSSSSRRQSAVSPEAGEPPKSPGAKRKP